MIVTKVRKNFYLISFRDLVDVSFRFHEVSCGTLEKVYFMRFFFGGGGFTVKLTHPI